MIETTVEIINPSQLKTSLSHQIFKLTENLKAENISYEEILDLFRNIIKEREFLISEIDNLKSILQTYESVMQVKSNPLVITLSEIEENLYNDFESLSSKLGRSDGEILNILMELFLARNEKYAFPKLTASELVGRVKGTISTVRIRNHRFLRISDQDLENLDGKIDFDNIKTIILDVTPENFVKYVNSIKRCAEVHVSTTISKLMVYARTSECQEIHFIPPQSENCLEYAKEANQVVEEWNSYK